MKKLPLAEPRLAGELASQRLIARRVIRRVLRVISVISGVISRGLVVRVVEGGGRLASHKSETPRDAPAKMGDDGRFDDVTRVFTAKLGRSGVGGCGLGWVWR